MALNATTLGTAIEAAFNAINAEDENTQQEIAQAIATEVINHIKSFGVVTVSSGIPVATTGTAAAQTGATTGTGTGTIA